MISKKASDIYDRLDAAARGGKTQEVAKLLAQKEVIGALNNQKAGIPLTEDDSHLISAVHNAMTTAIVSHHPETLEAFLKVGILKSAIIELPNAPGAPEIPKHDPRLLLGDALYFANDDPGMVTKILAQKEVTGAFSNERAGTLTDSDKQVINAVRSEFGAAIEKHQHETVQAYLSAGVMKTGQPKSDAEMLGGALAEVGGSPDDYEEDRYRAHYDDPDMVKLLLKGADLHDKNIQREIADEVESEAMYGQINGLKVLVETTGVNLRQDHGNIDKGSPNGMSNISLGEAAIDTAETYHHDDTAAYMQTQLDNTSFTHRAESWLENERQKINTALTGSKTPAAMPVSMQPVASLAAASPLTPSFKDAHDAAPGAASAKQDQNPGISKTSAQKTVPQ